MIYKSAGPRRQNKESFEFRELSLFANQEIRRLLLLLSGCRNLTSQLINRMVAATHLPDAIKGHAVGALVTEPLAVGAVPATSH